jgi:hypothetical protein
MRLSAPVCTSLDADTPLSSRLALQRPKNQSPPGRVYVRYCPFISWERQQDSLKPIADGGLCESDRQRQALMLPLPAAIPIEGTFLARHLGTPSSRGLRN